MTQLLSQSAITILTICLVLTAFVSALSLLTLRRLGKPRRERAGVTAAAYMTALGSLFAILTGFLINSEYAVYRDTQRVVGTEVAAASELAYASASLPPADTARIQTLLETYMQSLIVSDWPALSRGDESDSESFDALGALQRAVFEIGTRPYPPAPAVDTMQHSIATLLEARSQRVVIASETLPLALFILCIIAGLALIVNALVAALRSGTAYAVFAGGIILLVALDLAAILAISAPFRGPFIASTEPIAKVAIDLAEGRYLPWVAR